jgi:hypothetical protein
VQTYIPLLPKLIWDIIQHAAVMQGGYHLPRSDQKRMDEVRQIREAMASGSSILADKEITEIIR